MPAIEIPSDLANDLISIGLVPRDLVLYINSGCNLRCRHCYIGNELLELSKYYTCDSIGRFLKSFTELDRMTILGGEPFLHPEIDRLSEILAAVACNERRITTNLTLLRPSALEALKRGSFRLCVSLDGHSSDTHDSIRGNGAFSKTIENLRRVLLDGHDVEITHTITARNIADFWRLVELCQSLGIRRLNLHRVSLRGNALENRGLDVSATSWRQLTATIEEAALGKSDGMLLRYEVGFATDEEYVDLVNSGQYRHHSTRSFYSSVEGHRVVIFPNSRLYISSEAFGTESHIGHFEEGVFVFNHSGYNELELSKSPDFTTTRINKEISGDDQYPIPLSVSFRKSAWL